MNHPGGIQPKALFVLASSSPSRLAIVREAGIEPLSISPNVDEDAVITSIRQRAASDGVEATPQRIVTGLAEAKARAVIADYRTEFPAADWHGHPSVPGIIIAADSMLLLDGQLQGKPYTEQETIRRWKAQRGKTAHLITGHCVLNLKDLSQESFVEAVSTTIRFASPSDKDIEAYARSGEPLECAGAFTLEAMGGWFIDHIDGDPSSVIGLSLPLVRRAMYAYGYDVSDFWRLDF